MHPALGLASLPQAFSPKVVLREDWLLHSYLARNYPTARLGMVAVMILSWIAFQFWMIYLLYIQLTIQTFLSTTTAATTSAAFA